MPKKNNLSYILNSALQLSESQQLELISRISVHVQKRRIPKPERKSWMEMAGVGTEIWKGIDAQEYVKKEREEW